MNNALQKSERSTDVDPVIYVAPYDAAGVPSACCHVEVGDMRFLCPVSGDGEGIFSMLKNALIQSFSRNSGPVVGICIFAQFHRYTARIPWNRVCC